MSFQAGMRVRIKDDAFHDHDDPDFLLSRGKAGQLILRIGKIEDEFLWRWQGEDGSIAYPLDHEIEEVVRVS
ncbi:MAG: hypothetical protein EHM70_23465 [Chloroflexota bacterium]|nr:MAG: hypothetical protein EHM70_23465 [Chloroflexota bacterium]